MVITFDLFAMPDVLVADWEVLPPEPEPAAPSPYDIYGGAYGFPYGVYGLPEVDRTKLKCMCYKSTALNPVRCPKHA